MRSAQEIKAELDAVNQKRVVYDRQIADRRASLNLLNARVRELDIEYQAAVAQEQMRALHAADVKGNA